VTPAVFLLRLVFFVILTARRPTSIDFGLPRPASIYPSPPLLHHPPPTIEAAPPPSCRPTSPLSIPHRTHPTSSKPSTTNPPKTPNPNINPLSPPPHQRHPPPPTPHRLRHHLSPPLWSPLRHRLLSSATSPLNPSSPRPNPSKKGAAQSIAGAVEFPIFIP
jgi:hypothetical protein